MIFVWSPRLLRYIAPNGQFVAEQTVRSVLDAALHQAEERARTLSLRLRAREIATSEWAVEMRTIIKDTQLYSAALASGGWARMTPQLYGMAGRRIRTQYDFVSQMAEQIRSGQQALDGNFLAWSATFATSAWSTWAAFRALAARVAGRIRERNVLGEAEHCAGCLAETARGWVPLGALIPIGQRQCMSRDKCHVEYQ